MCSKADPNAPTFKVASTLPIKKNGCKITNVTTSYSGSTLYLTISGVRESGTNDVRLLIDIFHSYIYRVDAIAYIKNVSAGSSFSITVTMEDAIHPDYKTYEIWIN